MSFLSKIITTTIITITVFNFSSKAELLSGKISGEYEKGEYIVDDNIIVPDGKKLVLSPGTVLKFDEYKGIEVNGSLVCRGDTAEKIVFTSLKKEPGAYDWNGVLMNDSADTLILENTIIKYSTYGVKVINDSVKPSIKIKNTAFFDNGYGNIFVGSEMMGVASGQKVSYLRNYTEKKDSTVEIQKPTKKEKIKRITRISSVIAASVGVAATIGGYAMFKKYDNEYATEENPEKIGDIKDNRRVSEETTYLGFALIGAGVAVLGVSFFF